MPLSYQDSLSAASLNSPLRPLTNKEFGTLKDDDEDLLRMENDLSLDDLNYDQLLGSNLSGVLP